MSRSPLLRVTRLDLWVDPVYDARLLEAPGVALTVAPAQGDDDLTWQALRDADVYQISAAKDELPRPFHADATLLSRCPDLIMVSSVGAGYDTIDVDACTAAGVLIVNQAGGNAASVAEMTLGLMLAVSRRIVESDRRLRQEQGFSREDLMGRDLGGRTLGIVGIGFAGTATARLARAFGMRVLATDPTCPRPRSEPEGRNRRRSTRWSARATSSPCTARAMPPHSACSTPVDFRQ